MINVKLEEKNENRSTKPYPKLMRNKITHSIVLFISAQEGTFLFSGTGEIRVGERWYNFVTDGSIFEDFDGSIVLSND